MIYSSSLPYAIALTGGIGTGKSTVCNILFLNGYRRVDADKISHQLLDIYSNDIIDIFGDEYLKDNKINRSKLANLIFNDKKQKSILEAFLHPKIKDEVLKQCIKLEKLKFTYFVDIPLFFETSSYPQIKKSLVVYAPFQTQLQRVISRDNISKEFASAKIKSQMSTDEKIKLCDYVIDNSKDLKHLQKEIDIFLEKIS